mmetsp:Transcript_7166/g.23558  ORF Transcript_7166/g.23558 Transcript_7166/m.23558 type:complete len:124 (+) Transcript_7166:408-779(+)
MVSLLMGVVRLYSGLPPSQTAAHLACGYVLPWAARCSASSATAGRPSNLHASTLLTGRALLRRAQPATCWPPPPLCERRLFRRAWCTRPATFSHPTFSLIGDFALLGSLLTGRLSLNATSPAG